MSKYTIIGCGAIGGAMVKAADDKFDLVLIDRNPDALARIKKTGSSVLMEDVFGSRVIFVCVDTPQNEGGSMNRFPYNSAISQLRRFLGTRSGDEVVVIRSNIFPDMLPGDSFPRPVVVYPEFLSVASAVDDIMYPEFTVLGDDNSFHIAPILEWTDAIVRNNAPILVTGPKEALMIKWAANWFRAAKYEFLNVLADACDIWGADVNEVLRGFRTDIAANGGKCLKPMGHLGGCCLPKDLRIGIHTLAEYPGADYLRGIWNSTSRR